MVKKETLENWIQELSGVGMDHAILSQIRNEMGNMLQSMEPASSDFTPTALHEGIDFEWKEEGTMLFGGSIRLPKLTNGTVLQRVWSPRLHEVVFVKKNTGQGQAVLVPAIILDGKYEVNGRISNHWTWQYINEDLSLGETVSDYGGFYDFHDEFTIKAELSLKVFS